MSTATVRPVRAGHGHHQNGWVPRQHGAWAMLIVPFLLGAVDAVRGGSAVLPLIALFGFWFFGYFAFAAGSLWLKARRRDALTRPLLTWGAVSAGFGLVTLALFGPAILRWLPVYLPLVAVTLWLVSHRRERSTLSGLLTVVAACMMAVTTQFTDPAAASGRSWLLAALCLAYFFGTVPYVKTLIRKRGDTAWVIGSAVLHVAVLAAAIAGVITGSLGVQWPVFFAITAARSILVPLLGPMSGRTVTPKQAGIGEAVLSVLFVACWLA